MKEIITELISKKEIAHKNERKLSLPASIMSIKQTAFRCDNNLRKISFNKNLQKIEQESFESCKELKEVRFVQDSKLTIIPKACFKNCTSLKQINIPKSIVSISEEAFMNCTNLENLEIPKEVIDIKENAFLNFKENQTIIVYRDYDNLDNIKANIIKIKEEIEDDPIIAGENGNYKFEVICKCGHVGKAWYIPIAFPREAKTKKEAAGIAREIPRVKHQHLNVVLDIKKIGNKRFLELKARNSRDVYLRVKGKKYLREHSLEEKYYREVERRKVRETNYNPKYKKNIFKGKVRRKKF